VTFFVHSFDSGGLVAAGRARLSLALERGPASRAGGPRPALGKVSPAEHVRVGSAALGNPAGLWPLPGLLPTELRREDFHVPTARTRHGSAASNER